MAMAVGVVDLFWRGKANSSSAETCNMVGQASKTARSHARPGIVPRMRSRDSHIDTCMKHQLEALSCPSRKGSCAYLLEGQQRAGDEAHVYCQQRQPRHDAHQQPHKQHVGKAQHDGAADTCVCGGWVHVTANGVRAAQSTERSAGHRACACHPLLALCTAALRAHTRAQLPCHIG